MGGISRAKKGPTQVLKGYGRFYLLCFLFPLLLVSCAQLTDSTDDGVVERERVIVSGSITEDTLWEQGQEYVVVGDVTVEKGVTLTIQPDVRVWVKADTEDDYYGLIVKGKLIADGAPDSTSVFRPWTLDVGRWTPPGIHFAPARFSGQGHIEIAEEPGSWKGVWFESSADSLSVVLHIPDSR